MVFLLSEPTNKPLWNVFSKNTILGSVPSISSEVLGLFNNKNHLGSFWSSFDRQNWSSNVTSIRTTTETLT